jgi:hypothetical protein
MWGRADQGNGKKTEKKWSKTERNGKESKEMDVS